MMKARWGILIGLALLIGAGTAKLLLTSASVNPGASEWPPNLKKASADAKAAHKYLLLDFSGSDWCGWCKRLDKEVFSTAEFKDYASSNFVLVVIDFPRGIPQSDELKAQNQKLSDQYRVEGFPTVILLTPEGEFVGKTGYQQGGPEAYVEHLKGMIEEYSAKSKNKAQTP